MQCYPRNMMLYRLRIITLMGSCIRNDCAKAANIERSEMRGTPDVRVAHPGCACSNSGRISAPQRPYDLSVQILALQPHLHIKLEVIFLSIRTYRIVDLKLLIVFVHFELAAGTSLSLNRS